MRCGIVCVLSLLVSLPGCDRPEAVRGDDPPLVKASGEVTFQTTEELGPHRRHASIIRTLTAANGAETKTEEAVDLQWKDKDNWRVVAARDGKVRSEILVWEATAWTRSGDRMVQRGDAEPFRVELGSTWDPWPMALESLEDAVKLVPDALEEVEGRRAWKHHAELAPPIEGRRRAWEPTLVEGTVWIDELSALKLVGDLHVVATSKGRSQDIALRFATAGIGMDPRIPPPPGTTAPTP